jgi:hypothetical protein
MAAGLEGGRQPTLRPSRFNGARRGPRHPGSGRETAQERASIEAREAGEAEEAGTAASSS